MQLKAKLLILALMISLVSACNHVETPNPDDPYESFNRTMYNANDKLDKALIRPIARAYDAVIPHKVQKHVTLFFKNISLLPSIANNLLQADMVQAMKNSAVFASNATLGIAGLFDANQAFALNIETKDADLGTTLTAYGATNSEFIMLPLFGPQTSNQALALPFAMYTFSPTSYLDQTSTRTISTSVELVNFRSTLLPTDKLIRDAFDPYVFVKDAYLQNRNAKMKALQAAPTTQDESYDSIDEDLKIMEDMDFLDDIELLDDLDSEEYIDLSKHTQRPHTYNLAYRMKSR